MGRKLIAVIILSCFVHLPASFIPQKFVLELMWWAEEDDRKRRRRILFPLGSSSVSHFVQVRVSESIKIRKELYGKRQSEERAIRYGLDPYQPKFHGYNPRTNVPITIVFNEPAPSREKVMNWNPLTQSWFYSENAGLNWERVEQEDWGKYIERVDCLMEEPKYNGR